MEHTVTIDDFGPLPVKRPATVPELCALVRETRAAGQGLYPVGGRTSLDLGLPPIKPGVACDTTAMNAVIDYPARDMTVTVQAGITVAALQAVLAKEGQWLPIDVPDPERATLGGALAINASGPHRYGYGTLRDYVIGISFVSDDGAEVKAGGRVVKNVAGYDLMKLQIGALGTLGVVTQLTLKVKPRAEAFAALVLGCDSISLAAVLDLLATSKTRPVAVELLSSDAAHAAGVGPTPAEAGAEHAPGSEWVIVLGFEEKATAVRWQVDALLDEVRAAPVRDVRSLPDLSAFERITALQQRRDARFVAKLSVPPSKLAETLLAQKPGFVHAHALTGVAWLHADEGLPAGAVVRRCPAGQKKSLPVWGDPSAATWDLMRHVKRTLDPDGVFNPGRLFGDI